MKATPAPPEFPRVTARSASVAPRPTWLRAALRAPLFWKIFVPQAALLGGLVAFMAAAVPRVTSPGGIVGVVGLGVVVTAALSAWIIHLALNPIHALTEAARRAADGEVAVRAPDSAHADPRIAGLTAVFNEMLECLERTRADQRDGSRRVLAAEERERERIAHELYAGTAQTLAGVLIRLRILERAQDRGDPRPVFEEVQSEVRSALEEVRAVARRLRPPELDELGVRAALEAHARQLEESFGVPVAFHGDLPEDLLDPGARLALFRIVQEASTNAVQHSGASRVDVRFRSRRTAFCAEVVDDGSGFDPASAVPSTDAQLGLVGMRERAEYVRGRFSIDSTPGGGTVLRLDLPWAPTEPLPEAPFAPALELDLAHHF